MAKVIDNLITEGLSGKLGKRLVIRHMRDGRTVFATRPDYTGHVWTADQTTHHRRFQQASAYARHASKTNPLYKQLSAGTKGTPITSLLPTGSNRPSSTRSYSRQAPSA